MKRPQFRILIVVVLVEVVALGWIVLFPKTIPNAIRPRCTIKVGDAMGDVLKTVKKDGCTHIVSGIIYESVDVEKNSVETAFFEMRNGTVFCLTFMNKGPEEPMFLDAIEVGEPRRRWENDKVWLAQRHSDEKVLLLE